ncbi:unnamed protein product [Adineta ricciae]|uniref:FAD-binding domain-containing protein n=1 Tax=Adineta ricciae TaxID=249248 RepID=A0A814W8D6_ADIRI|nr:unnamed protein product [Adineta ricciae]CAF1198840.1 unnamed protein product [Adineta ricciae]
MEGIETPQIVVVGGKKTNDYFISSHFYSGGPVGLFTGIQIKILIPDIKLAIYEKHTEYQRKHVLRLNKLTTFFGFPPHPLLTDMINNLPSVVRTSVLEGQLLDIAKQLKIPIHYRHITNLSEFSNAQVIIGADGSHSLVREIVFENKMKYENVLKYVLEVKYEVYGQGEKLDYVKYQYRTQKQMKYIIEEHIGTEKDNRTPITIHLLIDQQTYEQMKQATFKNPFYLRTHKHLMPNDLLDTIMLWLNVKKEYANEKRVENSERITTIALACYASANVVHYDEDKAQHICLVGDAAFGVPFFRSLNNGIICSRKLASCIELFFKSNSAQTNGGSLLNNMTYEWTKFVNRTHSLIHLNQPLQAYSQFVQTLAGKEIIVAQNKAHLLFAADMMNKINGAVPWQVNCWSKKEVDHFKHNNDDSSEEIVHEGHAGISEVDDEYDLVQEFDLIPTNTS